MPLLRVLVPALVVLAWLAGAAVGGPYFGRVSEVSTNDQTAYLPASADATRVQERLTDFLGDDTVPAIVVVVSQSPLTEDQLAQLQATVEDIAQVPGVDTGTSAVIPSEDGRAAQVFVPLDSDSDIGETVEVLRERLQGDVPTGLTVHVTGPAGFAADLGEAFSGIDGLLLGVALAAVAIILVVVYRSILLPIFVLATSTFALCVALLINWWLAKAEILVLTGQTQGILFILVIGAATDYALLYTARFREELITQPDRWTATKRAWRGSVEPIIASGGTVIAGLLCLLLSDLGSNRSLGPVAAIGIATAIVSALTLLPSLLLLSGRVAFWPRTPHHDPNRAEDARPQGGYARVGRFVDGHRRLVSVAVIALLLAGAAGLTQLRADGVPQSELVLGESDAREGQIALGEHFPGGSGTPVQVIAAEADLQVVADRLLDQDGIASVAVATADSPSGTAPVTAEGIQPLGPPGTPAPAPTVADGDVLLQATLSVPADGARAEEVVRQLRVELAGQALVGGQTATDVDTIDASIHDRNVIIPVVLAVIAIILMILLRAIVVGVILLVTTVLSFATALGVSALIFNALGLPGADPAVPLYSFVFLVALGVDYNIFLMTRVREESLHHGSHAGILRGLAITGGVITSAGLVLAATFAALAVIPVLFLLQLAIIVALGVLMDTFIVRTLLVPALSLDLGRRIWWPSQLSRADSASESAAEDPA
ncbi:MMPL family transporter [Parenemella sanctibonifatiensis]|uniref:MMPL family transporter n=1 Tax=Parenemella sanctibonifatiensis TaxID=2016505 RepID=UPI001E29D8F1|nr:MMPL family transporter [Parenemella sanctibonifatiensis]